MGASYTYLVMARRDAENALAENDA